MAAGVPGCFDDLLNRVFHIKIVLSMADSFVARMNIPTKRIAGDLEWWMEQRGRIIASRGQKCRWRRKGGPFRRLKGDQQSGCAVGSV